MSETEPAPVIFGLAGAELNAAEREFFRSVNPLGFILFARNCLAPEQVRRLTASLRECLGRDAPVLIDQEGGRVTRLNAAHWRLPPPAAAFGRLYARDRAKGLAAVRDNARLIAADLSAIGVDVDCWPVLDVPAPDGHDIIGDRAFARDASAVAALGRAACEGLRAGGVAPVIKHIPGHGRARSDSHLELPVVDAAKAELAAQDFAPFRALADQPYAMTAHVVYSALDPAQPATTSSSVIAQVIRGEIGFDGLLLSDDLAMKALRGSLADRAKAALAAGCDVVLHCSGVLEDMAGIAAKLAPMTAAAAARAKAARNIKKPSERFDYKIISEKLNQMLQGA